MYASTNIGKISVKMCVCYVYLGLQIVLLYIALMLSHAGFQIAFKAVIEVMVSQAELCLFGFWWGRQGPHVKALALTKTFF